MKANELEKYDSLVKAVIMTRHPPSINANVEAQIDKTKDIISSASK